MSTCSLTILVENESRSDDLTLTPEKGFAAWIEFNDVRILFDAGTSPDAVLRNSERLGIDISSARHVVISHGHYDHTGALAGVLRRAQQAVVWMHPEVFRKRWSIHSGESPRYIGMPAESRSALRALAPEQVVWTTDPVEITSGITVTGHVPRHTSFEDPGGPFFLDPRGEMADDLPDDQALWIQTRAGLVVVTGCAHSGIVNILEHVKRVSGESRIRAVLGGFHLLSASPERLEKTVEALRGLDVREIYPCHCTGEEAIVRLHTAFPDRTFRVLTGDHIVF